MKKLISLLAVLQMVCQCCCSQQRPHYGSNPSAGKYYDIRGFKMYCEIYGQGDPVLMIHGNGGNIGSFSKTIPYFEKKYMVIVADSRAQGKSIDSSDSLTFEMMADDFNTLLDTLHIKKAYVIGWSDGGINALLLAIRHPDKVLKLASTGANIWPDFYPLSTSQWKQMQKEYNKENKVEKNKTQQTAKERNNWKINALDQFQPNIPLSALKKIQCPAYIICGDNDVIPIEHTKLIAKHIPQSTLWVVPNSGHATLVEHSAEFNKNVDGFFHPEVSGETVTLPGIK